MLFLSPSTRTVANVSDPVARVRVPALVTPNPVPMKRPLEPIARVLAPVRVVAVPCPMAHPLVPRTIVDLHPKVSVVRDESRE